LPQLQVRFPTTSLRPQPHGQLGVLSVEEQPFIKTADGLPRRSTVGTRRAVGPQQDGSCVSRACDRLTPQTWKAGKRHVDGDPDAFDHVRFALHEERGD
jgi:hypothetical protein